MPWKESSSMSSRLEFVCLARAPGANIRARCRAFDVSPKTAYKWLARFDTHGQEGLQAQSRRPQSSPARSSPQLEAQVLALHALYPCWGSRKLRALLPQQDVPHASTIDAILRRHGRQIQGAASRTNAACKRFEHEAPNLLWQMDFKGHFRLLMRAPGAAMRSRSWMIIRGTRFACRPAAMRPARPCRARSLRPSAAMACRSASPPITAHPGAFVPATGCRGWKHG